MVHNSPTDKNSAVDYRPVRHDRFSQGTFAMPQEVLRPVTMQLILENVLGGHLDS